MASAAKTAAANLSLHEKRGTRVRLLSTSGAARIKTRSVKEMAGDIAAARANAGAADKGKMTKVAA